MFLWKEGDPVQVVKNLHLPRFTLEKFLTDYCNSKTNTGMSWSSKRRFVDINRIIVFSIPFGHIFRRIQLSESGPAIQA